MYVPMPPALVGVSLKVFSPEIIYTVHYKFSEGGKAISPRVLVSISIQLLVPDTSLAADVHGGFFHSEKKKIVLSNQIP